MATRGSGARLDHGDAPEPGAAPSRRAELDDWLNAHVFHPLARRLAKGLAHTAVTPNLVSVAGGLCIVAAGLLYIELPWPVAVLLGFAVHACWHVLDGADGDLARLTGRASPTGEIVDGVCDYLGHALLYVLLAIVLDDWIGIWAWILGWASGISRVFQANHSESQRRTYLWRVYGVPWLKQARRQGETPLAAGIVSRLLERMAGLYVALAAAGSPLEPRIEHLIERASRTEAGRERARRICREESRFPLRLQTLLGPNWRTIALGGAMAAGSPLWYFLLETSLLNLLLLWSLLAQRRCDRRIVDRLEGNAAILGA